MCNGFLYERLVSSLNPFSLTLDPLGKHCVATQSGARERCYRLRAQTRESSNELCADTRDLREVGLSVCSHFLFPKRSSFTQKFCTDVRIVFEILMLKLSEYVSKLNNCSMNVTVKEVVRILIYLSFGICLNIVAETYNVMIK